MDVVSPLLRRDEAAGLLAVSERTVRRWGRAGVLDERRLTPRTVRVTLASVTRLLRDSPATSERTPRP